MSLNLNLTSTLFNALGSYKNSLYFMKYFNSLLEENTEEAFRLALWSRDCRSGAGVRDFFQKALPRLFNIYLKKHGRDNVHKLFDKIVEVGRFDDLLFLVSYSKSRAATAKYLKEKIDTGNKLAAKWMPRKGFVKELLRKSWGMSGSEYRSFLSSNTNVIETLLSTKRYSELDYVKATSKSLLKYKKAFQRNDEHKFEAFLESVKNKKVGVNSKGITPGEILFSLGSSKDNSMEEQMWQNLKNKFLINKKLLPVIDVSGSMGSLDDRKVSCIHHAIGMGLLLSEALPGMLNNTFLTFSSKSELVKLNKTSGLKEKVRNIGKAHWSSSTNLINAFNLIVDQINQGNLLLEDIPDAIVVFTDMEFNSGFCKTDSMDIVREIFNKKNVKMPSIIFWNLSSVLGLPENTQEDVIYLSGFSPSYMKEVFERGTLSMEHIIKNTLYKERYNLY